VNLGHLVHLVHLDLLGRLGRREILEGEPDLVLDRLDLLGRQVRLVLLGPLDRLAHLAAGSAQGCRTTRHTLS